MPTGCWTPGLRTVRLAWVALTIGVGLLPLVVLADRQAQVAAVAFFAWAPALALLGLGTWLGYGLLDIGLFLPLAGWAWWRHDRAASVRALLGAAAVAAAGLLSQIVKNLLCRARPSAPEAGLFFAEFPCVPAAYQVASFPSGHATTAFAAAVLLAIWYPRWSGAFLGLAMLVALSRIVLGSHFPSDVLAGALLGSAVSLAAYTRLPGLRRQADPC
jgi:undecaprenyl-diphosphatase